MSGCIDRREGSCHGEENEYTSRSGCTVSIRCDGHQRAHDDRMNALEARLRHDYPGYDTPGSVPPAWFDPANAGERWDDDE